MEKIEKTESGILFVSSPPPVAPEPKFTMADFIDRMMSELGFEVEQTTGMSCFCGSGFNVHHSYRMNGEYCGSLSRPCCRDSEAQAVELAHIIKAGLDGECS